MVKQPVTKQLSHFGLSSSNIDISSEISLYDNNNIINNELSNSNNNNIHLVNEKSKIKDEEPMKYCKKERGISFAPEVQPEKTYRTKQKKDDAKKKKMYHSSSDLSDRSKDNDSIEENNNNNNNHNESSDHSPQTSFARKKKLKESKENDRQSTSKIDPKSDYKSPIKIDDRPVKSILKTDRKSKSSVIPDSIVININNNNNKSKGEQKQTHNKEVSEVKTLKSNPVVDVRQSIVEKEKNNQNNNGNNNGNIIIEESKEIVPIGREESKNSIHKFYSAERERIKLQREKERETERENFKLIMKEIDNQEKEELKRLDQEEKEKVKAFEERNKLESPKSILGAKLKAFKTLCTRCSYSFDLLENLCGKLLVCTTIKYGDLFKNLDEMYNAHPEVDRSIVFARHHFGYELNKDLKNYSKRMKVVYCAVGKSRSTSEKSKPSISTSVIKQMYFSYAAVRYMLSSKTASDQYGGLRANLDVHYVRDVWDLLEDPLTNFFATQFGIAPAIEKMKINCDLRIPVKASDIFNVLLPQYLTHDDSEIKLKKKEIKWDSSLRKSSSDVFTSRVDQKNYRIRCLYISQYASEVDPSLILKSIKTRANFVEDFIVETPKRKLDVPSSSPDESSPALLQNTIVLHIHGGGWVSQSPDQHLPYISEWGKYAQLPVLTIDYSLSPEVQFPIPVNECFAIYKWLLDPANVRKLGLPVYEEPLKIIICGDSAGGNLTCATAIRAIQEHVRLPVGLLLHYPAVSLAENGSLSRLIFSNDPILNYETMKVVLDCYLGSASNQSSVNPLISAAHAVDSILSQFPSTVICVGDVDPLIDDSTLLFSRLQSVGVHTILKVYRGLPHGFLNLPTQLSKAGKAIAEAGVYLEWLYNEHLDKVAFEEKKKHDVNCAPRCFISGTRLRIHSNPKLSRSIEDKK